MKFGLSIADLKTQLLAKIDAEAEAVRGKFITLGEGQSLVYAQKLAEAEAILSAEEVNPSDFPLLHAASQAKHSSLFEEAVLVVQADHVWQQRSAQIEVLRTGAKAAVRFADAASEVHTAAIVDWSVVQ